MAYLLREDDDCARCGRPNPSRWFVEAEQAGYKADPLEAKVVRRWVYNAEGAICPGCLDDDDRVDLEATLGVAEEAVAVLQRRGLRTDSDADYVDRLRESLAAISAANRT
jgi:hypothetical protein